MAGPSVLSSRSPVDGEIVGTVEVTPIEAIDGMVGRAREAAAAWGGLSPTQRGALLEVAADDLLAVAEEIGGLMSREMGKPRRAAVAEVRRCGAGMSDKVDEVVAALEPEVLEGGGRRSVVHHDPLGVCAAITPWNYPASMIHWLLVPALVAGNTVLLKPSEETPLVGQAYADAFLRRLPEGVLQVVHGGDEQGKALVRADVDLVAFTGSRAAGKHIMRSAADGLKRIVLELGGKDPLIVLEGADVEAAADFAADSSFDNSGQACISTERIFVHESLAEAFEARLAERAGAMVVGDPAGDPDLGPMVNERQRDHVVAQVREAVEKGARLVGQGLRSEGLFLWPVLLADVTDDMGIAREETFGPVACTSRFDDLDAVVKRVNSSPYGLGAVVFGPEDRASEVARRLNAGMIGINRGVFGAPGSPWVGAKESGYGFHGSADGYRQFTQTRVVTSAGS